MIQLKEIFSFSPKLTGELITQIIEQESTSFDKIDSFEGAPTSMIFHPIAKKYKGSLHYMRFPSHKTQRFHYHPKPRYLLILGNIDLLFKYSLVLKTENPDKDNETAILKKNTMYALRFPAFTWHQFKTHNENGCLLAFSFHEDDEGENIKNGFMEELTFFKND